MGRISPERWPGLNPENPENRQLGIGTGCLVVVFLSVTLSILIWTAMSKKNMIDSQNEEIELYKDTINNLRENIRDTVEINTQ